MSNLVDPKKLKHFNQPRSSFDTTSLQPLAEKRPIVCLFSVITQYEFLITNPPSASGATGSAATDTAPSRKQVQFVVKDFFVNSLHERLTAEILHPPEQEDLPWL
jgi:hypothetical protein